MTVDELIQALTQAKERGLPGETAVVVDTGDWYTEVYDTDDPTGSNGLDMWFTINLGQSADSRFTPGGMPE